MQTRHTNDTGQFNWQHLAACTLVTIVMGSVHAFSVFLVPLETQLDESRATISLIYSTALIMITLSVLVGHHIYGRHSSAFLVLLSGVLAASGLIIAASASSWFWFFVGYGCVFGLANGFAYGYTLQLSAQLVPERSGFAMGTVTAGYALGSVVFAMLLSRLTNLFSVGSSLLALAALLALASAASAAHFFQRGSRFQTTVSGESEKPMVAEEHREVLALGLAYFCAVFAGLMAIGHASAIANPAGFTGSAATGAIVVGLGSSAGGVIAGWLIDRYASKLLLVGLALVSALALVMAAVGSGKSLVVLSLCLVGFAYGAIIAVYPVAIARRFSLAGPRVYGRVFISWGIAGLSAPWFAGWIFDGFDSYGIALLVAACVALLSAWLASRLVLE